MNEKECVQLLDYVNNALSEEEQKQFENHLQECEDCQALYADLIGLNEEVALHQGIIDPPSGMKKRILDTVFADEHSPPVEPKEEVVVPMKKSAPLWGYAAVAALVLSIGLHVYTMTIMNQLETNVATLEEERDELLAVVDQEATSSAQLVASAPLSQMDSDLRLGTASILQDASSYQLVIQVDHLPRLEQTEVYQVWMIRDGTPYPAGSFHTNEHGQGAVTFSMDLDDQSLGEAIAISRERQPNNQEPEGEILTLSEL